MARKIIVVTAAYGNDHVKSLGGQAASCRLSPRRRGRRRNPRELCSAEELKRSALAGGHH
ncbi:hypothetical protein A7K92_12435 [Klebsiella pneumoniae]|nr:hypothetical protein A7K92_12435 [Klebsiella pneumoniae]